ncbi:hypothetical protein EV361DRAFT_548816 [Lentinula raphanica]|nr:hypothetical protein EV361DRAFT_548816 [Lentinula raphanica]
MKVFLHPFIYLPAIAHHSTVSHRIGKTFCRKMFIGGLNWDTTDEGLRTYFSQFGAVDACTIMRDPTGRSRCFAFLTFEDPASVNAVVVKEHILDGKIIDPKRALPRQEHQRLTKLFVGGLAASVTSESMGEFFSQFGRVIDSTVMLDRETGRSKGFGFVSLEDANMQPFLGFGNLEIDGKLVDVKLAQPRYQRGGMFQEDEQNNGGGYHGGNGRGPSNQYPAPAAGGSGYGNVFNNRGSGNGSAPFDPQALAALYTRMFQMANGGAMNMNAGMRGGVNARMNPMMMNMGAMNAGRGPPRGPNGGGPAGMGVGPSRQHRGQHNYHPYGR